MELRIDKKDIELIESRARLIITKRGIVYNNTLIGRDELLSILNPDNGTEYQYESGIKIKDILL